MKKHNCIILISVTSPKMPNWEAFLDSSNTPLVVNTGRFGKSWTAYGWCIQSESIWALLPCMPVISFFLLPFLVKLGVLIWERCSSSTSSPALSVSLQTLADLIEWPHQSPIKVFGFLAGQVNQRTTLENQSGNILLDLKELGCFWCCGVHVWGSSVCSEHVTESVLGDSILWFQLHPSLVIFICLTWALMDMGMHTT